MSPIVGEGWWWMKEVCHVGGGWWERSRRGGECALWKEGGGE